MPGVGLKPTTPVFERPKTVHALGRAATVIGYVKCCKGDQIKDNELVRARIPMRSLDISVHLILPLYYGPGVAQHLTDARPARKADNQTAICDPIV
jgi:hypothetical protein